MVVHACVSPVATWLLLTTLPTSLVRCIVSQWVDSRCSGTLAPYCNRTGRGHWLGILNSSEAELLEAGLYSYANMFDKCRWLRKEMSLLPVITSRSAFCPRPSVCWHFVCFATTHILDVLQHLHVDSIFYWMISHHATILP